GHLQGPPAPRRQDRAAEPAPPARRLIHPPVVHPRRGHLHRARRRGDLPRPGMPVTHHQPTALLVPPASVCRDVGGDLVLQRSGQHPPRPLPGDLIQARGQVLARSPVSDYLQHWRPPRRRWPAGIFPLITCECTPRPPSGPASTTSGHISLLRGGGDTR